MAARGEIKKHVLVINDTPHILELFDELLSEAGYRVTLDRFTAEADHLLTQVKEARPDLIVLDFMIGDEARGWQFLQMLKMDRESRAIRIVVCSAAVQQVKEMQTHLDEMGVAVVLKPFDIDYLLSVIEKALAEPEG
jgi:CheY-like chemotaxis protein